MEMENSALNYYNIAKKDTEKVFKRVAECIRGCYNNGSHCIYNGIDFYRRIK